MIYNAPVKDMVFLIDEWIGMDKIASLPGYEDMDRDTLEFILEEAGKFCTERLLPLNREGDEHGATFTDGVVKAPPGFKEAYQEFIESGWTSIDAEPAHGGQGLPKLLQFQVDEMLGASNLAFKLYSELSHGAYNLMLSNASKDICDTYLAKIVEGVWSGTMCLTEPHSGTDLGLLNTKAVNNGNGSYSVSGTKIFITSGDHDLTENILHLVLARLEGAADGARGISLFLVPRTLVNGDGSLGERNTVSTGSIEHKMGIRGSPTCVLNFDQATGYLIGTENKGLSAMFTMMNLERLTVGLQGLGISEIAYQNALAYANERLQGKALPPRPNPDKAADPIVFHPEVRRQLMKIRCQVEGARALGVYACYQSDIVEKSADPAEIEAANDTLALLTPLVKSFLTDLGMSSTLSAQQLFGGHGYVCEHGMEQLVRDCRITQIYEGTNEIQAMDLVTRKLTMNDGRLIKRFLSHWQAFLQEQDDDGSLAGCLQPVRDAFARLQEATTWIKDQLQTNPAAALGAASDYQRLFALTTIGCLWLSVLVSISGRQGVFYERKRKVARFYGDRVLPETAALHQIIMLGSEALSAFDKDDFDSI
jgi:alkylation response protein AidB-like acyl-CoA dehydrogenase